MRSAATDSPKVESDNLHSYYDNYILSSISSRKQICDYTGKEVSHLTEGTASSNWGNKEIYYTSIDNPQHPGDLDIKAQKQIRHWYKTGMP